MNWHRLTREPSTWRGLVWLLTAAGVALSPDQQAAIVTGGMALAGLLGAFLPDSTPPRD
jgi:hypothetical protein